MEKVFALKRLKARRKSLLETRGACNFRLTGIDREIREVENEIKELEESEEV